MLLIPPSSLPPLRAVDTRPHVRTQSTCQSSALISLFASPPSGSCLLGHFPQSPMSQCLALACMLAVNPTGRARNKLLPDARPLPLAHTLAAHEFWSESPNRTSAATTLHHWLLQRRTPRSGWTRSIACPHQPLGAHPRLQLSA
jgi:hypothetical protein